MQINPFGISLGAGMQSAAAFGDASAGFAAALGVAVEGGAPNQLIALTASANPPKNLTAKLAQTLLVHAQIDGQPAPLAPGLPGLQQPTSLAQLMTTAAKLPPVDSMPGTEPSSLGAQSAPALITASVGQPEAAAIEGLETAPTAVLEEPVAVLPQASTATPLTQQAAVPAQATPVVTDPEARQPMVPPQTAFAETNETMAPHAPASSEAAPSKSPKNPRSRTATLEPDIAQPVAAQAAVPAEIVASAIVPQPIAQPQAAPRELATLQTRDAAPAIKKAADAGAPTDTAAQLAPRATTADFAGAISARGEFSDAGANAGDQAQTESRLHAAPKIDTAVPQFPQPVQPGDSVAPARAAAPVVAAEPVIEARSGHLGQSLGVEIARKVTLGEETLRIRLNPIELGRIEVTLGFDDKGTLQATVRAESAQAMDLLRQDAPELARTLDQAGVRTDAQSFRFENRGGDSGGQQGQQHNQQSNRGRFASSDDEVLAEPIHRPIRSDGQVDLLA